VRLIPWTLHSGSKHYVLYIDGKTFTYSSAEARNIEACCILLVKMKHTFELPV
jgi:hypothetical protein